jgi:ATP-dependent Zn protease
MLKKIILFFFICNNCSGYFFDTSNTKNILVSFLFFHTLATMSSEFGKSCYFVIKEFFNKKKISSSKNFLAKCLDPLKNCTDVCKLSFNSKDNNDVLHKKNSNDDDLSRESKKSSQNTSDYRKLNINKKNNKDYTNNNSNNNNTKLSNTDLYLMYAEGLNNGTLNWEDVYVDAGLKAEILGHAKSFFNIDSSIADMLIPEIVLLYGLSGMDKSSIVKGLGSELGLPVIIIDPMMIPGDFQIDLLMKYIQKKDSDCIVMFKDIERFSGDKTLFFNFYKLVFYGLSSIVKNFKHKILFFFSCNQDYMIQDLKLYQSEHIKFFVIQYPSFDARIALIRSILKKYTSYVNCNELDIVRLARTLKHLTNKDIKNIIHGACNNFLALKNDSNIIFDQSYVLAYYKEYMQNIAMVSSREEQFNRGLLEFDSLKVEKDQIGFTDVIGLHHIKNKLKLYIHYLDNIELYKKMKINLPHGILFVGKPGCGKTLLARALASESDIPFIALNGSDIINKYVGSGASKIREVFNIAKSYGKAIIYIDEIDAIGMKKSGSTDGGEKEYTQTINALLVEMDGFMKDESNQIIVIGSTNRQIADLEPALLRRFEDKYYFLLPSFSEREEIIRYYTKEIVLADDISISDLASKTIGYSSADIVTFVNNAKYYAIQKNPLNQDTKSLRMTKEDFIHAYYEASIGYPLPSCEFSSEALRQTAIHEIGHALCQLYAEKLFVKNGDIFELNKNFNYVSLKSDDIPYRFELVTIEPRSMPSGTVFGFSSQVRSSEYACLNEHQLRDRIIVSLGGYCAEKEFLGYTTEGVGSDLEKATYIAKRMLFLGMNNSLLRIEEQSLSSEQQKKVEETLQQCMSECFQFLRQYSDLLLLISKKLLENKILYRDDMFKIIFDYFKK